MKKIFFCLLLVFITIVYILFFDRSRFIWAGSFIVPFVIWLSILILYLTGARGAIGVCYDKIKAERYFGPKKVEFDKLIEKKSSEHFDDFSDIRELYENGAMDPETELFDYALKKMKEKRQRNKKN